MKVKYILILALLSNSATIYSQVSRSYRDYALPVIEDKSTVAPSTKEDFQPKVAGRTYRTNDLGDVVDGADVNIFPSTNTQSEVHISVNKIFPGNILASANTAFGLGNSLQGFYVSVDGGVTWTGSDILPNNAGGRGDPSTCFDAQGNGYLVTMSPNATSSPDGYFVQRTTNEGSTWDVQVRGTGPSSNFDKEMVAADNEPISPFANNFYCAWTDFSGSTSVRFNRSIDGLNTFTTPITLRNGFGQGANVQTGVNGEVYVCWANYGTGSVPADGIGFSISTDGGANFSTVTAFPYSGIRTTTGANPLFNNTRVNDFPAMAVDKSCGEYRGRIYIAYPTRENGNGRAIIQVRSSSDNGANWSNPTTVSIDAGRQNWFPWISVDDATGVVTVIYYSLDSPTGFSTNTYVAYSYDGGTTFTNIRVSDVPHITAPVPGFSGGYAGDYIGIASYGGRAYAAWADDRNGTWQIYVSPLTFEVPILFSSSDNININGPVIYDDRTGDAEYQAENHITAPASGLFSSTLGGNVIMTAGQDVTLLPGFTSTVGSEFVARTGTVDACANANSMVLAGFHNTDATPMSRSSFGLYPNPSNNIITVKVPSYNEETVSIEAQNLDGKFSYSGYVCKDEAGTFVFNVETFPPGYYIYKVNAGQEHFTGRFTKK